MQNEKIEDFLTIEYIREFVNVANSHLHLEIETKVLDKIYAVLDGKRIDKEYTRGIVFYNERNTPIDLMVEFETYLFDYFNKVKQMFEREIRNRDARKIELAYQTVIEESDREGKTTEEQQQWIKDIESRFEYSISKRAELAISTNQTRIFENFIKDTFEENGYESFCKYQKEYVINGIKFVKDFCLINHIPTKVKNTLLKISLIHSHLAKLIIGLTKGLLISETNMSDIVESYEEWYKKNIGIKPRKDDFLFHLVRNIDEVEKTYNDENLKKYLAEFVKEEEVKLENYYQGAKETFTTNNSVENTTYPIIRKELITIHNTSRKDLNHSTKIPLLKLIKSDFPNFWCYGNYMEIFETPMQKVLKTTSWNNNVEDCFIDFGNDIDAKKRKKEIVDYSEDKPLYFNLYRLEIVTVGDIIDDGTEKLYIADHEKLNNLVKSFLRVIPIDYPYYWKDDRPTVIKKKGDPDDNIYSFLQFHFAYFDGYKEDFINNLIDITSDIWNARTQENKIRKEILSDWIKEKIETCELDLSKLNMNKSTRDIDKGLTAVKVASGIVKENEADLMELGIMPNNSNKIEKEKINYSEYEILRGGLVLHWFEPKLTSLVNGNGRKEDFLPNMYCGNGDFYMIIANFCLKEIVEKCRDWEELGKFLDYNFYRCPDYILFLNFIYFSYKPYFTNSFSEHDFEIVKRFDLPINRKIAQYAKEWIRLKIESLNLQDISFDAKIDLESETTLFLSNNQSLMNNKENNNPKTQTTPELIKLNDIKPSKKDLLLYYHYTKEQEQFVTNKELYAEINQKYGYTEQGMKNAKKDLDDKKYLNNKDNRLRLFKLLEGKEDALKRLKDDLILYKIE